VARDQYAGDLFEIAGGYRLLHSCQSRRIESDGARLGRGEFLGAGWSPSDEQQYAQ
jgi:hypothetical protein